MSEGIRISMIRTALFITLTAALLSANATVQGANSALVQVNLHVTGVTSRSISVAWDAVPGITLYSVFYDPGKGLHPVGSTTGTSYTVTGLRHNTDYIIDISWNVNGNLRYAEVRTRTAADPNRSSGSNSSGSESNEPDFLKVQVPLPSSCNDMPSRIAVTGFNNSTQCQIVGAVVIAKTDLLERGFVDAVDVWGYVPNIVEVCFRNIGWLAFLDAAFSPRSASKLESVQRDGMTCGSIDRAGTVVLLASAPPTRQTAENALPIFEAIPLSDCQIKLVETLFLRETPGGEIIGLVWMNSEVPVFEINGYWYKIEFEGQTGYISRFFRTVLRGGCG